MPRFSRTELLDRYHAMIARGEPIVGGGAGTGLSAKCEEAGGIDLIEQLIDEATVAVCGEAIGISRKLHEGTLDYTKQRKQFGQPIGKFQGTGFKLADMKTELEAAELLTLRAAWKDDQGTMTDTDAAMAKLFASEALARVTDNALQIFGGMGLMDELPIERFWRDARVERIWDGTSEIQRHIISRALLRPLET
jgi:alkylation response protein AidB-like acyl-CoA dehydrogenase